MILSISYLSLVTFFILCIVYQYFHCQGQLFSRGRWGATLLEPHKNDFIYHHCHVFIQDLLNYTKVQDSVSLLK